MADSSAIRAGGAFVELFADNSKLTQGLRAAGNQLKAWGAGISSLGIKVAALGGAITAPLLGAAHVYVDTAVELGKMSQRTGIAVEELSALSYVAARSGLDMEGLEIGIKKMQKTLFQGGQGSETARVALHKLGISLQDMKAMTPDQQLMKLADAFHKVKDPTQKAGLALEIFGRAGTTMIPFLESGSAEIKRMEAAAKAMGIVLGVDDVKVAKDFKMAMRDLRDAAMVVTIAVGQAVIPAMTRMRERVMPIITSVVTWVRVNKGLFDSLFDIGTGITVAGVALIGIGKTIQVVGGMFVPVWQTLGAVLGFVLSPVGVLTAAVIGLGAAFLYLTESGGQVRDAFSGLFAEIGATFGQTWKGIMDALKANQLGLAFDVALAGIKVAWLNLKLFMTGIWQQALAVMKTAWNMFWVDLQRAQSSQSGNMAKGFIMLGHKAGLISFDQARTLVNDIDSQTKTEQQALNVQANTGKVGVSPEDQRALDAQKAELAKAQAALAMLAGQAAAAAPFMGKGSPLDVAMGNLPSITGGTGVGTFSAEGSRAMGAGMNWQEETAKRVEDLKGVMNKILDELRQNQGARFA